MENKKSDKLKIATLRKQAVDELLKIATLRKQAVDDLGTFRNIVPNLNQQIRKTTSQLEIFESRLKTQSIAGWTSYEIPLEGTDISASKQVQDIVQYLQQVCVSEKCLGKLGRKLLKATQYNAVRSIQKWYRAHLQYLCLIKTVTLCQAVRRGYTALKQMIAKKGQQEPSTEIETRPGTPVGKPGTPAMPPEKQPEQRSALVVGVSRVCKKPTRAAAPVRKPSVQVDDALEECRTHWKEDPVFYTVFLLFVFGVLFWSIPVSPAQCTANTCQNTFEGWVV